MEGERHLVGGRYMNDFGSIFDSLVPCRPDGTIDWAAIPPAPALWHEDVIQRDTRVCAFYAVGQEDQNFRAEFGTLLRNWTETAADVFRLRWPLGKHAARDMAFSYTLWSMGLNPRATLMPGPRSCGVDCGCERRVPPPLLNAENVRLGALRLWRKDVLGWSWQEVAKVEAIETGRKILDEDDFDNYSDTIRQDVKRWREALGVRARKRRKAPAR